MNDRTLCPVMTSKGAIPGIGVSWQVSKALIPRTTSFWDPFSKDFVMQSKGQSSRK